MEARQTGHVIFALASHRDGVVITPLTDDGEPDGEPRALGRAEVPAEVARLDAQRPPAGRTTWVWDDTTRWYPPLLAAGVRVERCVDLRLSHAILRNSELTAASALARADPGDWDEPATEERESYGRFCAGLFDLEPPRNPADPVAEFRLQREAIAACAEPCSRQIISVRSFSAQVMARGRY